MGSQHSASSSSTAAHKPRHPILLFFSLIYLSQHAAVLQSQSELLVECVRHGQAGSAAALGHLLLCICELACLGVGSWNMLGVLFGTSDAQLADRTCVQMAIVPFFQNLMAANNQDFLAIERSWWIFHATMMMLSVLYACGPTHALVMTAEMVPLLAWLACRGHCYWNACDITMRSTLYCTLKHGILMIAAGMLGWFLTYTMNRRHSKSQNCVAGPASGASDLFPTHERQVSTLGTASQLSAQPSTLGASMEPSSSRSSRSTECPGGPSAMAKIVPAAASAQLQPYGLDSGRNSNSAVQRTWGILQFLRPRSVGAIHDQLRDASPADQEGPAKTQQVASVAGEQMQTADRSLLSSSSCAKPSPMPLETLGIHLFRTLGLEPALQRYELSVNQLVDRLDDTMVVRIVCLPIGIYSVWFAIMARLRMVNYDLEKLAPDLFVAYLSVWFILGRDSVKFDLDSGMRQVQDQLAASFAVLRKPRQQTVTELVDSVRHQIAGPRGALGIPGNIAGDDVEILEALGEGTFGRVYKGIWRGTVVAIKSMVLASSQGGLLRRERMAIMEAAISSALSHPNILQTYTYSMRSLNDATPSSPALGRGKKGPSARRSKQGDRGLEVRLVLEFMDRGTLREALDRGIFRLPGGELKYGQVLDTAADVAKGMLHLHSLNIVHGDLKARNVLLNSAATGPADARGFTPKISDFGLSQKMDEDETHVSSLFQGTATHMAPEVFLHGTQSKAADVYSFGITLWEIYTGQRAFADIAKVLLPHSVVKKGERPHFPADTPAAYRALAERCWSAKPQDRPSFAEAVATLMQLQKELAATLAQNSSVLSKQASDRTSAEGVMHEGPPSGPLPQSSRVSAVTQQVLKRLEKLEQRRQAEEQQQQQQQLRQPSSSIDSGAQYASAPSASGVSETSGPVTSQLQASDTTNAHAVSLAKSGEVNAPGTEQESEWPSAIVVGDTDGSTWM